MKQLILKKLTQELKSGIDTEAKTLHLLVEIQKIHKLNNQNKTILDFYRDWAVHTEITHGDATHTLLGRFERHIEDTKSAKDIATEFTLHEPDFFKLYDLKTELKEFLTENKLPRELTDNKQYWYRFVILLLEILKECAIKPKDMKIDGLSIEEDSKGETSFRFHLTGRRDCPKPKLKWKSG